MFAQWWGYVGGHQHTLVGQFDTARVHAFGICKEWNLDAKLVKVMNYKKGHEEATAQAPTLCRMPLDSVNATRVGTFACRTFRATPKQAKEPTIATHHLG